MSSSVELLEGPVEDRQAAAPPAPRRSDWFVEARFGLFIHWGLYAIPARGEWIRSIEKIPDADYLRYFREFDPRLFDAREWAAWARRAGQKYVVLTAKHHDGFCLFDSALTNFKCTNTKAGVDLCREYVEAFRAEGLKVGFYYSLIDWHHPDYPVDKLHPRREDEAAKAEPRRFERYLDYLHGQVRELLTGYGKIDLLWFDFSYDNMAGEMWRARELVEMVRELQPHILLNNRLNRGHGDPSQQESGWGDFTSPEQIIPPEGVVDREGRPVVWEACITLNEHWGYARDDVRHKSPAQVIHMLVECVSKGGNLLLNVGPTARGEFPEESTERLRAVGKWLRHHGESIFGCGNAGLPKPDWGRYTRRGRTLYAHIFEKPIGPVILPGLGGKVARARLLRDGSEVDLSRPWNAENNQTDAFLNLPGAALPDELDTVVALDLV